MHSLIFSIIVILFSSNALAVTNPLTAESFFNNYPDVWEVQKIESMFYDEIIDESLYAVSFSYVTEWACAGHGDIDFCGPANDEALVETCEYFMWNGEYKELEATEVSCEVSPDELIDEKLKEF